MFEREDEIEDECVAIAEAAGWLVRKMAYVGRRGCRDRDFYKDGVLLMVEFKAPGEKPRKDQRREHEVLKGKGFDVHVIDNVDDFRRLLRVAYI